jgi:hypothetical protein
MHAAVDFNESLRKCIEAFIYAKTEAEMVSIASVVAHQHHRR